MKHLKRLGINIIIICTIGYVLICIGVYSFQEKLLFFPKKTPAEVSLATLAETEEIRIKTKDNIHLSALRAKVKEAKGIVYYLHGNGGSISTWIHVIEPFRALGYEVFLLDYRGYGKSEGSISSQQQLFEDIQVGYDEVRKLYQEKEIIVLGYSLGSGLAAQVAAQNEPKQLILQAPYYSITDMMTKKYAFIPTFLLQYPIPTHEFIQQCSMPITLFHGKQDELIPYNSSVRLAKLLKPKDQMVTLENQGHNGMTSNTEYLAKVRELLE